MAENSDTTKASDRRSRAETSRTAPANRTAKGKGQRCSTCFARRPNSRKREKSRIQERPAAAKSTSRRGVRFCQNRLCPRQHLVPPVSFRFSPVLPIFVPPAAGKEV